MRTSAIAASAVLATGLMGLGGTAFADGGTTQTDDTSSGEDTTPNTTQVDPVTNTQAIADAGRSVVGLNVPVSADVHEGVANNLNVQDVARDAVHLGRTANPVHTDNADNTGQGDNQADILPAQVVTEAVPQGTSVASSTASAVNVGDTVNRVVASASATVNNVAHVSGGGKVVQGN